MRIWHCRKKLFIFIENVISLSSGLMSTSLWAPLCNASIKDMKCCEGPVDQILSEGLFRSDLKKGRLNERWSLQCSGNYVLTGDNTDVLVQGFMLMSNDLAFHPTFPQHHVERNFEMLNRYWVTQHRSDDSFFYVG